MADRPLSKPIAQSQAGAQLPSARWDAEPQDLVRLFCRVWGSAGERESAIEFIVLAPPTGRSGPRVTANRPWPFVSYASYASAVLPQSHAQKAQKAHESDRNDNLYLRPTASDCRGLRLPTSTQSATRISLSFARPCRTFRPCARQRSFWPGPEYLRPSALRT